MYKYDIPLYSSTAYYYLLTESNDKEIYFLRCEYPTRLLIHKNSIYYNVVSNFYIENKRDKTIKNILNS